MKRIFISIFISFLLVSLASAQSAEKKRYKATQIAEAPAIDGILDDKAWAEGEWTDDFTQFQPFNGRKPYQRTEFKVLFDDNNLFVAIKSFDTSPDSIVKRLTRRDHEDGDMAGIVFDSFHDLRTGFFFGVSAGGVKFDQMITGDGQNEDMTWDPNWWVGTSINKEGWVAEMRIPFSQLRFEKNSGEVWGVEVMRTIYRRNETDLWQQIPADAPGLIHLFGEMSGLEQVKPRKVFDITPYGVAQVENFKREEGNPFLTGKRSKLNGGLDVKIGVTNNLTMDLTINPDFGQVEADPSEVNLTAYETYFKEKRPFFIEGNNILSFGLGIGDGSAGNDNLFYSRRIGRRPQIEPDYYYGYNEEMEGYYRTPDRTSILGAVKLTGKTQDGLSVGFMNAVTGEELADIDTAGHRTRQVVEPLTNYLAARVQKDYNEGNTIIGGMVTAVNRFMDDIPEDLNPDQTVQNTLSKAAYTGGLDFSKYFHKKTYMISLNTAFSYLEGSRLAMVQEQESSARYFQRPGNRISLDSSRTSLSGNGGKLQFMKTGNGHWSYGGAFLWKTPGLELNDMGYLREADQMLEVLWGEFRLWEPKSFYHNININANQFSGWDFSGNHLFDGLNTNFNINFKNYWLAGAGTDLEFNVKENSMLRGGPVMKLPGSLSSWMHINSDTRKKFQMEFMVQNTVRFQNAGFYLEFQPEIIYKPVNTLSLSLIPTYTITNKQLQYIDQQSFGEQQRYLFGSIRQKVLGMSFRINYNLTPDLTLQYWGQPFIASGKYSAFKHITNPIASEFKDRFSVYNTDQLSYDDENSTYNISETANGITDYSFSNPDFNVREFLSNLVIRWEYNPGSSIYLVWSQTRSNYDLTDGRMNYGDDMNTLFSQRPHNVFLVKFSYRFGLR